MSGGENSFAHVKHFLWPVRSGAGEPVRPVGPVLPASPDQGCFLRLAHAVRNTQCTLAKGNAAVLHVDKLLDADAEAFPLNAARQESVHTLTETSRTADGPSAAHTTFDMQKRLEGPIHTGARRRIYSRPSLFWK